MKNFTFDKTENYRTFLNRVTKLGFKVEEDIRWGITLWLSEIPKQYARVVQDEKVVAIAYNEDPNA